MFNMQKVGSGVWGQVTCDEWQAVNGCGHISGFIQDSIRRNQLLALTHNTAAHFLQQTLHLAKSPYVRTLSDRWSVTPSLTLIKGLTGNLNKCPKP